MVKEIEGHAATCPFLFLHVDSECECGESEAAWLDRRKRDERELRAQHINRIRAGLHINSYTDSGMPS